MPRDDAGGGRRGPRAVLSTGLLEAVREAYGLGSVDEAADLGGSSNLNVFVRDASRRLVIRVYRPYVTEARLGDIHAVRRALIAGGVPCAEPVPTREGRPWFSYDGRLVEAEPYVDHDACMDSPERVEAALPLLGCMHAILRGVEAGPDGKRPLFANHIEARDMVDRTRLGAERIRRWGGGTELADAALELALRLAAAEPEPLPRQLVHGDFWDNNVFFREGRVVLVADFDFMGERARIDDLALTLYFTSMNSPEAPVSDAGLSRLRRLVDAYDRGLTEPLSSAERAALPLALARQPLWSIGGWVALLDDEQGARQHAAGTVSAVDWALGIVRDLDRWQAACT